ncbi:nucleoside triphosphate pyrophosphohydrolase family protein [Actinacidiphila yeochonensis]|uniref:hypothetical protein n=1 Tax=Actinacidiphila yeochonensis TaxID=89050 RepID=UPI000560C3DA|nr:hypothetical protein [Actinacidiphila yeochonensis]
MTSDALPGTADPTTLSACQDMAAEFRRRAALHVTADVALLDACAELGELAGAYLKQSGYAPSAGAKGVAGAPPSDRVRAEFGDALFALLSFADAAGLDAEAEFLDTMNRYEARFAGAGSAAGSGGRSGAGTGERRG